MSRRALAIAALVVVMACVVRPASGEPEVSKGRRAAAIGAAVVPGLVVHGSGHFVLGERRVARRLLFASGIGLGLVAAGGVPLVLTGASRHYTAVPVAMLVGGVGVFALSWAADLYGATGAAGPRSPLELAPVELELGYGYVYDPRFDYRNFAVTAASVELGWFRVAPVAWIGLDDDNQRLRLEGAYRIAGEAHGVIPRDLVSRSGGDRSGGAGGTRTTGDASRLEIQAAATHHRYPDDGFAVETLEASVAGRLDMARIGDSLAGSFADLSLGIGSELTNYYAPGAGADVSEMLLARFGYGVALGCPGGPIRGEASIYYDHRRDTFAGGISPGTGPGSGFVGLFGVESLVHLGSRWGGRARFEQGAARVLSLGILTRFGDPP